MNKTKNYKNGTINCKAYSKSVGNGWECGFYYDGKLIYVGNFIHSNEASYWFTYMNREIKNFSKKYKIGKTFPKAWFAHFLGTHLYKSYYNYLDRLFSKYQGHYSSLNTRNIKKYQKYSKTQQGSTKVAFLKAA